MATNNENKEKNMRYRNWGALHNERSRALYEGDHRVIFYLLRGVKSSTGFYLLSPSTLVSLLPYNYTKGKRGSTLVEKIH